MWKVEVLLEVCKVEVWKVEVLVEVWKVEVLVEICKVEVLKCVGLKCWRRNVTSILPTSTALPRQSSALLSSSVSPYHI